MEVKAMRSRRFVSVSSFIISLFIAGTSYAGQWANTYGGSNDDWAYSIQQTSDGGYIVAGETRSFGAGSGDFWVLKLDGSGNVQWQKTYGGTGYDYARSIQQTTDGGYIVAGVTYSYSGGYQDVWVLKLDQDGNVIWQKTYGGGYTDIAFSIRQTSYGGYILVGYTTSAGAGKTDIWVLRIDQNGNVLWQKTYGGSDNDFNFITNSIQQTSDGGYIVTGRTYSFGAGNSDVWILKLDGSGNVQWQKTYGGSNDDWAYSIQQTSDDGYIVAGGTVSFGAGNGDFWVLKLDSNGNVLWQKTYGGTDRDSALAIQQTSDGGYIVAGYTNSFGAGKSDVWILKLDSNGNISGCYAEGSSIAIVTSTNASVANTSVTPTSTNVNPGTSNAIIKDTNASPSQVCSAVTSPLSLPAGQNTFNYSPVVFPEINSTPALCKPFSAGNPSSGNINLRVGLPEFTGAVDVYLAIYAPHIIDQVFLIWSDKSIHPVSEGIIPWRQALSSGIEESLYGDIPTNGLPSGRYTLGLLVSPAGDFSTDGDFDNYYLWITYFDIE